MIEINYENLIGEELRAYCEEGAFIDALESVIYYTFERFEGEETPDESNMYDTLWEELDQYVAFNCDSEDVIVDFGLSDAIDEYKSMACEFGFTDNNIDLDKIAFAVLYNHLPSVDDLLEEFTRLYGGEDEEEEEE